MPKMDTDSTESEKVAETSCGTIYKLNSQCYHEIATGGVKDFRVNRRTHFDGIFRIVQTVIAMVTIIVQACIIIYLINERRDFYKTQPPMRAYGSGTTQHLKQYAKRSLRKNRTIIVITPTYLRLARMADMTRLAQTLMHISQLIWVVVEDASHISLPVKQLLDRTGLRCYYLAVTRLAGMPRRGWTGREAGLAFVRERFASMGKNAVVYFADDDNSYDIRLFDEHIRNVDKVGVWAVGLVAQNVVEAPKVLDRRVIGWQTVYAPKRRWGLDMAAFAINLDLFLQHPRAGWKDKCKQVSPEPCLLDRLNVSWKDLEPFGLESWPRDILVWHTKTDATAKTKNTYGYNVEIPSEPIVRTAINNIMQKMAMKEKKLTNERNKNPSKDNETAAGLNHGSLISGS